MKIVDSKLKLTRNAVEKPVVAEEPVTRYVSYRNLLMTGRAVKYHRSYVVYSTAGENPKVHKLTCVSGKEAKRIAGVFANELRRARTDGEYNATLARLLEDIKAAWPEENRRVVHVHECRQEVPGLTGVDGRCDCGFDWTRHQLTKECNCHPTVDGSSDLSAEGVEFVKHRPITRKEIIV